MHTHTFEHAQNATMLSIECTHCNHHHAHDCIYVLCTLFVTLCRGYRDTARLLGESCWPKNERPRGWNVWIKRSKNRELATRSGVGEMEAHWQLMLGTNMRRPGTKYKRSKIVFSVTSIVFTVVHTCCSFLRSLQFGNLFCTLAAPVHHWLGSLSLLCWHLETSCIWAYTHKLKLHNPETHSLLSSLCESLQVRTSLILCWWYTHTDCQKNTN